MTAIKPARKPPPPDPAAGAPAPARPRSPAAERALAEAKARRERRQAQPENFKELAGRDGLEPTRYGDWEVKGLASDF